MGPNTTLQDIADRLKLSRTTISLALRDHPRISLVTKKRVWATAKKLSYTPDHVARSLATGHSNLIGVMVTDSTNPYYAEVIRGIEDAAAHADFHVVLANGSYEINSWESRIKEMMRLRVAGIVATPPFTSEKPPIAGFWAELRRSRFPFLLLNRQLNPPIFHQISADNMTGVRLAIEALSRLGHRRVAYVSGTSATVAVRQRLAAFKRFGRKYGFENDPQLFISGALGPRGGYEACHRMWTSLRRKPTAIMTLSDAEAFGVLRFLKERGVEVPRQVSVMGFDGFEAGEFSQVSLSTIGTSMRETGKLAVELIIEIINKKPSVPFNVIKPVRLLLRESVGPADSRA